VVHHILACCSADYRFDQRIASFEGVGEMIRNMRGYHAGQQRRAERPVTAANIEIVESADQITATDPQRPCALQNEPSDRIRVLSEDAAEILAKP
jgi:hypothetical protein